LQSFRSKSVHEDQLTCYHGDGCNLRLQNPSRRKCCNSMLTNLEQALWCRKVRWEEAESGGVKWRVIQPIAVLKRTRAPSIPKSMTLEGLLVYPKCHIQLQAWGSHSKINKNPRPGIHFKCIEAYSRWVIEKGFWFQIEVGNMYLSFEYQYASHGDPPHLCVKVHTEPMEGSTILCGNSLAQFFSSLSENLS
jgi:hypothetical protein